MPEEGVPKSRGTDGWTMSDERAMLEKIVYHRFNFFMVLVTVLATSIARSDSVSTLKLALGAGLGLSLFFLLTLWKNQRRLNAALDILVHMEGHPVNVLGRILGPDSAKGVIGFIIPLLCVAFLLVCNVLVWAFAPGLCDEIVR